MSDNLSDLYAININSMVNILSNAYVTLVKSNIPFSEFPSVMLWGPPGVGKSQGVREVAEIIANKTDKKVIVTDVRLLLFNPVDLRGIPTANEDKTLAVWLKPKIFQMDDSDDVINILFLDEISAAPPSVQAAAYQITLDRTVGEHKLPENCIIIAAGNRVTDKSVAFNMPKALANRLCHFEIIGDNESWREWAISAGINDMVIRFLDKNPSMLMEFCEDSELAFPTPRSWEKVSNILNYVSEDFSIIYPLIAGCIGVSAAYEFRLWGEINNKVPSVEKIFSGDYNDIPTRPEVLLALSSKITLYIREHYSKYEVKNAVKYVSRLPVEFKDKIFSDFLKFKPIHKQLSNIYEYDDWFARKGYYWEDYEIC